jgi:hypothetical protein
MKEKRRKGKDILEPTNCNKTDATVQDRKRKRLHFGISTPL